MFRETVMETQLVGSSANEIFKNIAPYSGAEAEDVSFMSTLRTLLYPRMSVDDSTSLMIMRDHRPAKPSEFNPDSAPRIAIVVYPMDDNEKKKYEEDVPAQNWERVPKVRDFYRKNFWCNCWINRQRKSVMYIVNELSLIHMHYLQASIPAVMPWYFDDAPLNENERQLINALCDRNGYETYLQCINNFAEQIGIRELRIHSMLGDIEHGYIRAMIKNQEQKIESNRYSWDELVERQRALIHEKIVAENELKMLKKRLTEEESADETLENYFMANKNLILGTTWQEDDSECFRFCVLCNVSTWDEDEAEANLENDETDFYEDYNNGGVEPDDVHDLLTAIFIERRLILRFCAVFEVRFPGSVEARSGFPYFREYPESKDYMPNTHIDRFRCWDNYKIAAEEAMYDANVIGAIEQCIGATEMLNFSDSTVMCAFVNDLFNKHGSEQACLSPANDSSIRMTSWEALNYIREENHKLWTERDMAE